MKSCSLFVKRNHKSGKSLFCPLEKFKGTKAWPDIVAEVSKLVDTKKPRRVTRLDALLTQVETGQKEIEKLKQEIEKLKQEKQTVQDDCAKTIDVLTASHDHVVHDLQEQILQLQCQSTSSGTILSGASVHIPDNLLLEGGTYGMDSLGTWADSLLRQDALDETKKQMKEIISTSAEGLERVKEGIVTVYNLLQKKVDDHKQLIATACL